MYESHKAPLLPRKKFALRILRNFLFAALFISFSLGLGTIGYHVFADLPWIDALLNASMILTGMGPVDVIQSTRGKLFATFYALFSGVIFLVGVAILFAPIVHRFLHKLHLEDDKN